MDRRTFAGLSIVVENPAGSTRYWHDRDGRQSGATRMLYDYGFIDGHVGSDGDELDVYLGPDEGAPFVYVVHQMKAPAFTSRDEDKIMLGFASEADAKAAYLAHRNDGEQHPGPYGGMSVLPLERFKAKLERRTGTGPIRAEVERTVQDWLAELAKRWRMEGMEQIAVSFGDLVKLDVQRDDQGKIRVNMWDRGMTPGYKEKDGKPTEFSPATFGQMIANWKRRGEKLAMCFNHQSAYTKVNGQPAPALAYYNAVAVVQDGQVVQFEKLGSSSASPPDVAMLAEQTRRALATDENPNPSPDGCWWFRFEVTEIGQQLLPGFAWLSPMFEPEGKDEEGRDIGYVIYDLAATNTAFQAGCMITFNRAGATADAKARAKTMFKFGAFKKKFAIAFAQKFSLFEASEDKVKEAYAKKMEDAQGALMGADDPAAYKKFADDLEEMAKAYEDSYEADDKDETAPHVAMRKMSAKFRRLAAPVDAGAAGGGAAAMAAEPPKDEEKAQEMERAYQAELRLFAQRLRLDVPANASSKQLMAAIEASSVPASTLPGLVQKQVAAALFEAENTRTKADTARKAKALVDAAIDGGYPEENGKALLQFASDPATYEAAKAMASGFLGGIGEKSLLFQRMTAGGAPLTFDIRQASTAATGGGKDQRIVRNDLATFVVEGEQFSKMAISFAEAKEGPNKAAIDEMLSEEEQAHPGHRLIAANRLLKKQRPDLWSAAEELNI